MSKADRMQVKTLLTCMTGNQQYDVNLLEVGCPAGKGLPANQPLDAAVFPNMKSLSCGLELLGAPEQRFAVV